MIGLRLLLTNLVAIFATGCASVNAVPELDNYSVKTDDLQVVSEDSRLGFLADLAASQLNWSRNEPRHYKYVTTYSTYFICGPSCGPNEVEVKDGKIVNARFFGRTKFGVRKGTPLPEKYWGVLSIDSQLDLIEEFVARAVPIEDSSLDKFDQTWLHVEYDPVLGFPTLIRRNDPLDNHGDHTTRVGYFEVIED